MKKRTGGAVTPHLLVSLRASLDDMTPALAGVAEVVLADPEAILSRSITEVAEASATSEASVVRFCRSRQFSGFGDFKLALAQELAAREHVESADSPRDDIQKLADSAIMSLRDTEKLLVRPDIAQVAKRLLAARTISCFGVAASFITAQYLAYKLTRIGRACRTLSDSHIAMMAAGSSFEEDVFVIISSSGSTLDAVRVAEGARGRGAYVVGIGNSSKNPLAANSDLSLTAAWSETPLTGGALPSKISQLLIVDAVIAEMARQDPDCVEMLRLTAENVSGLSF